MTFRMQWPTKSRYITQHFLANYDYYMRWNMPGHDGLDIGTQNGDEVYACADGVVSYVELNPKAHPHGIHVRLHHKHPDGIFKTVYAHLQEARVMTGDRVKAGAVIGLAGITGNTTGQHLHITLRKVGATKNGETQFRNERGQIITMPNDIIDPTPFLDPQPSVIPSRPVAANHPSSALLGGKSYIPYEEEPDLYATQPMMALQLSTDKVTLIFEGDNSHPYQINRGVTIKLPGKPADYAVQNAQGEFVLHLGEGLMTFHDTLPWQGEKMRVSAMQGLTVSANATTSSKELARLPYHAEIIVSSTQREGGNFIWRQILAPDYLGDVFIKEGWVTERTLDGSMIYLMYLKG